KTSRRAVQIELTDVKEFSYGEYGDGSLDIWAAGKAGWFTIKASRAYRETYSDMTQALKLLYFMADSYKAQKKYGDLPAPQFFVKCSEANLEGCKDVVDVAEMFTKHRHFLITSMLMNKEGVQWSRVPLYTWLQVTFPDDFLLVQRRIKPPRPKPAPQKSATQSPAPLTASARRKKATAKQQSATPKSAVSVRPVRSTRSARSQSNATSESVPIDLDGIPAVEQVLEIVSTTPLPQTQINQNMSSSDDDIPTTGGKGKGKSALRPKPSKFVRRASHAANESPSATQIKKVAALAVSIGSDAMSIDSPAAETEESSDKLSEDTTEDSDDDSIRTETRKNSLPLRLQDAANNGDVWHCPVDGCMHKTYAASELSSQILIKRHSQTHDFDHDERVQLVRRMEAPYLPVNRLMDRVRDMAASSKFPPPITQRY
ncbi:hypothetical protein E4T44_10929, partial [Aureobasidium sp. EXF-8845]